MRSHAHSNVVLTPTEALSWLMERGWSYVGSYGFEQLYSNEKFEGIYPWDEAIAMEFLRFIKLGSDK